MRSSGSDAAPPPLTWDGSNVDNVDLDACYDRGSTFRI